jgi:alkaline phosphatase D
MRVLSVLLLVSAAAAAQETRQATGVKVGEVTADSAMVWMRRTAQAARNKDGVLRKGRPAQVLPAGVRVESLEGSAPGAAGRVRVRWAAREDLSGAAATPWAKVSAAADYAHVFTLERLQPDTLYHYSAETEGDAPLRGSFRTAPRPDSYKDVTFTVITGQMYAHLDHPEGFHIYETMLRLAPDFIVPTGDNVYYDSEDPRATTIPVARYHWQRMYSLPRLVAFHLRVPGYWEKDDHDTLDNDCWPARQSKIMPPLTFADGQRIFLEQVPMGPKTYRTFRWGKALQVWLTEGRDFRSPNDAPDGPEKTIWGAEQKRWLKESILASDADWKVLVSPTPIVGPDRVKKGDNHANQAFQTEGSEFREWAARNAPRNFFIACGDRHWQYHSVDPKTGVQEFSSGPASDEHADGSPGENPKYHRFHRVKGGFLSVRAGQGGIAFRFHDVHGKVVYEARPITTAPR